MMKNKKGLCFDSFSFNHEIVLVFDAAGPLYGSHKTFDEVRNGYICILSSFLSSKGLAYDYDTVKYFFDYFYEKAEKDKDFKIDYVNLSTYRALTKKKIKKRKFHSHLEILSLREYLHNQYLKTKHIYEDLRAEDSLDDYLNKPEKELFSIIAAYNKSLKITMPILKDDSRRLLQFAKDNNLKRIIATNIAYPFERIETGLVSSGLDEFFTLDDVVASNQIGYRKPEKEFFMAVEVLAKLGREVFNDVYITIDKELDIQRIPKYDKKGTSILGFFHEADEIYASHSMGWTTFVCTDEYNDSIKTVFIPKEFHISSLDAAIPYLERLIQASEISNV